MQQHGNGAQRDRFPTDPAGLPEAGRPELLELGQGDTLKLLAATPGTQEHAAMDHEAMDHGPWTTAAWTTGPWATVGPTGSSGKTTWSRSTASPPPPPCTGGSWTGPPAPTTRPSTGTSGSASGSSSGWSTSWTPTTPCTTPSTSTGRPVPGPFPRRAPEPNLVWKDTVLVRTGQTVDILFDVSNPGLWMAHCHIAEHMQSGMMFSFNVARTQQT